MPDIAILFSNKKHSESRISRYGVNNNDNYMPREIRVRFMCHGRIKRQPKMHIVHSGVN